MKLMRRVVGVIAIVAIVTSMFGVFEIKAKEITLKIPTIKVKSVSNGTGIKVTISKSKDAEGFEVYAYGVETIYSGFKQTSDKYEKVAEINQDGSKKRVIKINSLPAGTYKIKVRAYNKKKYGTLIYSDYSKEKSIKLKESASGYSSKYDFSKVKKGDVIKFGSYEQDGNFVNGKEALEWIVLSKSKSKIFVVSKHVIDTLPYDMANGSTWEECTLRKWLNEYFYTWTFNEDEKKKIITTTVENFDNVKYNTLGGDDTEDNVFLLSQLDMIDTSLGFSDNYNMYDVMRRSTPTEYCKKLWIRVYDNYSDRFDESPVSGWWLRSPGGLKNMASYVSHFGTVDGDIEKRMGTYVGVRPAMYINIK